VVTWPRGLGAFGLEMVQEILLPCLGCVSIECPLLLKLVQVCEQGVEGCESGVALLLRGAR
jgi:hypothetical protein